MTPERKAALLDLLARVEKAEGPDREIDADVVMALERPDNGAFWAWRGMQPKGVQDRALVDVQREYALRRSPACSASIDAALALVERVLPEWKWSLSQRDASEDRSDDFYTAWMMRRRGPVYVEADHSTASLAALAALLKALTHE